MDFDQLNQCVTLFQNADLSDQIIYGVFTATVLVFVFIKKSLPSFVKEIAVTAQKLFKKEKK